MFAMGEESEDRSRCSLPCQLGAGLIVLGAMVLVAALCSLAFTTSYFVVFPSGTPLWTGSLFIILGIFVLVAFRMGAQPLAMPSKVQMVFTLVLSTVAVGEALLAVALSVWNVTSVFVALQNCNPQSFFSQPPLTCECSAGFIDPPSLLRTVYRFSGVSDCSWLGRGVVSIHSLLLALYCTGAGVSLVLMAAAGKKLYAAGKSGIYLLRPFSARERTWVRGYLQTVTPAASSVSRQFSFGSSAIGLGNTTSGTALSTVTQRFASLSQATLSTSNHSPAAPPSSTHAII